MFPTSPLEFLRGKYAGPGVPEWTVGLATSALLSANIQVRLNSAGIQNSTRYYFRQPWVLPLQNIGVALYLVVLAAVAGWLVWPNRRPLFEWTLVVAASLVPPVAWAEIAVSVGSRNNPVFVLDALQFHPVNNVGVLGATVFLLYLLVKQPFSRKSWLDGLLKAVAGALVVLAQMAWYQWMSGRVSR